MRCFMDLKEPFLKKDSAIKPTQRSLNVPQGRLIVFQVLDAKIDESSEEICCMMRCEKGAPFAPHRRRCMKHLGNLARFPCIELPRSSNCEIFSNKRQT